MTHEACHRTVNATHIDKGYITSENYPLPYPSGAKCTYRFNAREEGGERVVVKFTEFNLGQISPGSYQG